MLPRIWCMAFLSILPLQALAESVTTHQINLRTLNALKSCLDWKIVGQCLWKKCDLLGCRTSTTPKVRHFIPDLLVIVYASKSSFPWIDLSKSSLKKDVLDWNWKELLPVPLGTGNSTNTSVGAAKRNLRFFEAKVVGHTAYRILPKTAFPLCEQITEPKFTYFDSLKDNRHWRFGDLSALSSLKKRNSEFLATDSVRWGNLYPRTGFIHQTSPVKAAAVVGFRACDILLNDPGKHQVESLEPSKPHVWPPTSLDQQDLSTGSWQMISPKVDSNCRNLIQSNPTWDFNRIDTNQAFIWSLWRRYECCTKPQKGKLIAHHDF